MYQSLHCPEIELVQPKPPEMFPILTLEKSLDLSSRPTESLYSPDDELLKSHKLPLFTPKSKVEVLRPAQDSPKVLFTFSD